MIFKGRSGRKGRKGIFLALCFFPWARVEISRVSRARRVRNRLWNRLNLLSISENSYSIDCTKSSPFHKIKTKPTMIVMEFFFISGTFVLLHFNKTVNKQTLSVLIDDLKIITIIVNLYKKIKIKI